MRRLVSLVLTTTVMFAALPATAAPSAGDVVVWNLSEDSTITLEASTNLLTVSIVSNLWVECAGGSALATVELLGEATVATTLGRHGRTGSFNGTVELDVAVIFGGCGDYLGPPLTSSVSGSFETFKGKAERWREGSDRLIRRQGTGTVSVHSLIGEEANVTATRTISR